VVSKPTEENRAADRNLVRGLKRGDQEAYRVLVDRYQKRVFGIAYGITLDREASLELAQDVFLTVFRKIDSFREEASLATWLHRIAVNLSLNRLRRWKRRLRRWHQPLETEEGYTSGEIRDRETPERRLRQKEFAGHFEAQLKALPHNARAILVLKETEGLSYDEIAAILNISKGTVSSRLFYARKRLKEAMQEYLEKE
jgi:RNA polymerase sigma-70 factor (ECF subfamily)